MRLQLVSATLLLGLLGTQARAQPAPDITGTFQTEDGRAKIRLEKCGEAADKLCGYVVWMKEPLNDKGQPRTDVKNPDPAKRNRPSLGMELMTGLEPEDATHFSGEIYNADDGKKYQVTMGMEESGEVKVRGCLLHFLCGSQTWARVADIALPGTATVAKASPTGTMKPSSAKIVKAHPAPQAATPAE